METSAKRTEILKSAAQAFAEQGFDNANINDIAANAGLGKGTIYLYFTNKKALYLGVLQYTVDQFNQFADQIMQMPLPPLEKIEQVVRVFFSFDPEFFPFLTIWARHQFQNAAEFAEDVQGIFKTLRQPLCEIVELGTATGEFCTSYPITMGYLILSLLAMLTPELRVPYGIPTIPPNDRIVLAMDVIRKLLGVH